MDERIIRYFGGELPEEERIALLRERETDEKIKEDFATIQNLQSITHLASFNTDHKKGREGYLRIEQKVRREKLWLTGKKIVGYAAVIAITFMVARMFTQTPAGSSDMVVSSLQELYVPSGQRARITLPDGSIAWLNAGSSLLYPSVFEKDRKVRLEGEGFFEVAKNTEKPFIVETGDIEIKALGTQFNVSNYPKANLLSATLTQGSILVYQTGKESTGQILEPNQQLFVENGIFRLEKSIDLDDLLWKDGIYSFKKEKMGHIIKKLELYFDVEITVTNPQILEYKYTGKFRQRDGVMEILRIIQKIHHFKIESNESLNKITLS